MDANALELIQRKPMLCKRAEVSSIPKLDERLFELKKDGTRGKGGVTNNQTLIINRRGINYNGRLPEIETALARLPNETVIDFEIMGYTSEGEEDFTVSQRRCASHEPSPEKGLVKAIAFDILMLEGQNLMPVPYLSRKEILYDVIHEVNHPNLLYLEHSTDGEEMFAKSVEGVVAKTPNGKYGLGVRDYTWLKIKKEKEVVANIVGYTRGEGKRANWFGTLILADPTTGRYIGKSGGGFKDEESEMITQMLRQSEVRHKPFRIKDLYTPVQTSLQVEVTFQNWTVNKVMRMPRVKRVLWPQTVHKVNCRENCVV